MPIIGDPIRDLTIWFSNRLSDANRAGVESLQGRFLTPIDPLADPLSHDLYGKVLILVIPLLVVGGIVLGYLLMTARTSGEGAYTVRAVTPRFVIGAVLAILGIFLVSVLAQFVATTDVALVEVSVSAGSVGGPAEWPAAGGPFLVLQNTGFDPRLGEGPGLWNTGAWLSAGFLSGILLTLLGMVNVMLTGIERLLVALGPICLAAYALPATQRVANLWLKVLGAVLAVRFVWAILFVFFSLEAAGHLDASGAPVAAGDVRTLLGIAVRGGGTHARRPDRRHPARSVLTRSAAGRAMREREVSSVPVPENPVRDEPIAFGLTGTQLGLGGGAALFALVANLVPLPDILHLLLVVAGSIALVGLLPIRAEPAYRWLARAVRYRRSRRDWAAALREPDKPQLSGEMDTPAGEAIHRPGAT